MDPSIDHLSAVRWFCTKEQPQSTMFRPRCLAVGMMFLGSGSAFLFLQMSRDDARELNFGPT